MKFDDACQKTASVSPPAGNTYKRDLLTLAKETYLQKRPTDTYKRDLLTLAKETY
jgi:hypothetical protein